jgi:cobalt-zinc-cadmium efflux system membrane fusion protein
MKTSILVMIAAISVAACGRKTTPRDGAEDGGAVAKEAKGHDGHEHGAEPGGAGEHAGHGANEHGREEHDHEGHGEEGEAGRAEHEGEERAVQLTPEAVRAAQFETAEAATRPLTLAVTAPGRIAFTSTGVAYVAPRVAGRIESIDVKLGDRVKKGAVLAHVESSDLGRARADYLAAATRARVAEANFRREKELLGKGITSEREMREAESAAAGARADLNAAEAWLHTLGVTDDDMAAMKLDEHPSAKFPARSPIDGTVVEIQATLGQSVESNTTIFTVGDLSNLWVLIDAAESQLASLATGQEAVVTVPALPGRTFGGRIEHIGDVVEEKSRTVHVRVAVPNRERLLKPGMFATAEISATSGTVSAGAAPRVVVPREAVQVLGTEKVVFVPDGEGRFAAVEVRTGAESGREIEIVEGVAPGTKVVSRGAFVLKSELSKEAMSGGHAGHGH